MGPNGAVCPGPVLRPSRCSQPRGNGSHLRPNPRHETIEEPIGIYLRAPHAQTSDGEERVWYTISIVISPPSVEIRSRAISSKSQLADHTIETLC